MSIPRISSLMTAIAAILVVALLGLMSGCALTPEEMATLAAIKSESPDGKETVMRKRWIDKPYRELVKHMGREGRIMDIPRYGWPPSSAVVFGFNEATGCIDAFFVLHGEEPMIKDYFCR